MTTSELELKTRRFAARMNDKELSKAQEILDDIRLIRRADAISAQKNKLVPWEVIKARLDQRFGITD
jgi:hypothetical protein